MPAPDTYEFRTFTTPGIDPESPADLLIEVPHGADSRVHFAAVRNRLTGELPDDLEAFYYVNTDVGAYACARQVAGRITSRGDARKGLRGRKVKIARSLIPRTFIDCNRDIGTPQADLPSTGVTPGLPEYITNPDDIAFLKGLYREYRRAAERAYESICGAGGLALMLHTYAPRSIRIDRIDDNIVDALREAYEPSRYADWPRRPDVDLITEAEDGTVLAPSDLAASLRDQYARAGVTASENASYRLHPATMGYRFSRQYPGQMLCMEINRELLVERFIPFEEMTPAPGKVERMAAPIAAALLTELDRRD